MKDAARIAHFGLAVRLKDRERTGAMGSPLPPNFFCMPFSALHAYLSASSWHAKVLHCS